MFKARYDEESWSLVFCEGSLEEKGAFPEGTNVFVCAALQDPEMIGPMIGRNAPFAPAFCRGFRRVMEKVGGRDIPFMLSDSENPDSVLTGTVYLGLSDAEVRSVEKFELENRMRRRIKLDVFVGEKQIQAVTYIKR